MAYGIPILPENDPNLKAAQDALDVVLESVIPGKYLVDTITPMKYLPEWLPGTSFLQDAKHGREVMTRFLEVPFADAERHIVRFPA